MSEAPKRIGIDPRILIWHRDPHETDWNYIRADLVEAAIKRALERAMRIDAEYWKGSSRVSVLIAELDPAQFIEEEKK